MADDQLRQDLEALYASLEDGWTCLTSLGGRERRFGVAATENGYVHGCLYNQMTSIADAGWEQFFLFSEERDARIGAMVAALGFVNTKDKDAYDAMYDWNDDPNRTWEDVQERVKEAIGRL